VEGDTVHVESKIAGGKKVKQGKITVFDLQGNSLLEGRTDAQGKFSFEAPKKRPIKIVLDAGMGHRAQWTLDSEDMQQAALEREKTVTAQETGTAPDIIQQAVETALDKKLAPIMKMLSESQEKRVSLKDILGGIGYILGLMGVAAYFHYRRRSARAGREKD
jgi:nickel transport protein